MAKSIYVYWATEIIEGRAKMKNVPSSFKPNVRQIIHDRGYQINLNGTCTKIRK